MSRLVTAVAALLVLAPAASASPRVVVRDSHGRTLLTQSGGGTARVMPAGEGSVRIVARAEPGARTAQFGFDIRPGERFFGFGSRSNAVDHRGHEVENYVADGPYREEDRNYVRASVPPWATRDRDDATYYPVPWMLSSRGFGVLIENDETSRFRLGTPDRPGSWSAEVEGAELRLRVFEGPAPADALRRFTEATGRQPPPSAPWIFGPWFQTGQPNVVPLEDEARITRALRDADAPVSAAETQMHYLPCGAHRGNEDYLRRRNAFFRSQGLAHLAYFNPSLCASYSPVFERAVAAGVLQRGPLGEPFTYPAFVGGSGPAGFTQEPLAQFDYTAGGTEAFYAGLVADAVAHGHDGWMEDFGESTPPFARSADGTPGERMHNRYPTTYHCAVMRIARRQPRPIVRLLRSGWTGTAACADDVWGGDPTTVWGFDGLESTVRQALGMGMSGVSRFGTDIGGYHSFGPQQLTREMLIRWIQFGAVSGVMRTKRSGIAVPSYNRPQVFDPNVLPLWRRYAKLHTQLHPYLLAADRHYRRTGVPLMRHHVLTWPRDARAVARMDEFGFGPSFVAAPVLEPGRRERRVYAPPGRWLDFWRSVDYDARTGGLFMRRPRVLQGARDHAVPAPLEELPLLVRTGSLIAMLPPEVDTLADYGASTPGIVRLADRRERMDLLLFPRGRSSAEFNEGERLSSRERVGRWDLRVRGERRRTYFMQASLGSLRRRFRACRVTVNGRRLRKRRWRYDRANRSLRARFTAKNARLVARACRKRPARRRGRRR